MQRGTKLSKELVSALYAGFLRKRQENIDQSDIVPKVIATLSAAGFTDSQILELHQQAGKEWEPCLDATIALARLHSDGQLLVALVEKIRDLYVTTIKGPALYKSLFHRLHTDPPWLGWALKGAGMGPAAEEEKTSGE